MADDLAPLDNRRLHKSRTASETVSASWQANPARRQKYIERLRKAGRASQTYKGGDLGFGGIDDGFDEMGA